MPHQLIAKRSRATPLCQQCQITYSHAGEDPHRVGWSLNPRRVTRSRVNARAGSGRMASPPGQCGRRAGQGPVGWASHQDKPGAAGWRRAGEQFGEAAWVGPPDCQPFCSGAASNSGSVPVPGIGMSACMNVSPPAWPIATRAITCANV